jgi:hypothetical protein
MLHAGLDLSRRKLDVCLLSDRREHLDQLRSRLTSTRCAGWRARSRRSTPSRSWPWSSR